MTRTQLINKFKTVNIVISGIALHHFGSKLLDHNKIKAEILVQNNKDDKLNKIYQTIQSIKANMEVIMNKIENINNVSVLSNNTSNINNVSVLSKDTSNIKNTVDEIVSISNEIQNIVNTSNNDSIIDDKILNIMKLFDNLTNILEVWTKDGNTKNFISNFNFNILYDFLDSLTLLQESAFIHILIFIILLCCIINIISVFFGNEIIKYFNVENKYPSLSKFLKLRLKFQKYYLL